MPDRTISAPNYRWSMDFVSDRTHSGGNLRILILIDEVTRECLALEVDTSLTEQKVAIVLNRMALFRGLPKEISTDNGSEFTGNILNAWAHDRGVEHIFTDPGCPTQAGYIESFNGKLRHEWFNQNWFLNLYEARDVIEQWQMEYNHLRPIRRSAPNPRGIYCKASWRLLTFHPVEF